MKHKILERLWKDTSKVSPCLFYPAIIKMGFSIKEVLQDSKKQAEVFRYISEYCPSPVIIRMSELWCEAASFGVELSIEQKDFPHLGRPIMISLEEADNLTIPEARNKIIAPMIDAVALASQEISKPIVAGITGPYTLASVLCDAVELMMGAMMNPEVVKGLLEKVTDFLIACAREYKKAGAAGILIAEPSVAMISPEMTEEFSNAYIAKIIAAVQDDSFFVIYHNCGAVSSHLEVISSLLADAFHFGSDIDMNQALSVLGSNRYVMGNIDPRLFLQKDAAEIQRQLEQLKIIAQKNENFIISTGCDLSPVVSEDMVNILFC